MDHTKEPERYSIASNGLPYFDNHGEYVRYDDYSFLCSTLAEKTAQVERLREALIDFKDLTSRHVQWTARGKEMKSIAERLEKIDEALAETVFKQEGGR